MTSSAGIRAKFSQSRSVVGQLLGRKGRYRAYVDVIELVVALQTLQVVLALGWSLRAVSSETKGTLNAVHVELGGGAHLLLGTRIEPPGVDWLQPAAAGQHHDCARYPDSV